MSKDKKHGADDEVESSEGVIEEELNDLESSEGDNLSKEKEPVDDEVDSSEGGVDEEHGDTFELSESSDGGNLSKGKKHVDLDEE